MFYTYAHYTPQGRLFYIGKGSGERRAYNMHNRNDRWNKIVAKYGKPEVKILATWDKEKDAFSHEVLLISCFRDMGYKLANLTDGGEGSVGIKVSEETRLKLSLKLKGRKGKKPSEETRAKLRASHLGQKSWSKGLTGCFKMPPESVAKKAAKMRGHTHNVKFKYIGTNIKTNEIVEFIGNVQIKNAGFEPACIRKCASGERKKHKGYTWSKELLKGKI